MKSRSFRRLVAHLLLVIFTAGSVGIGTVRAQPAPPPTFPAQPPDLLGKDELRELVAPIALYPDVVLASLLPATTNPDQLHDAAQFVGDAPEVENVPEDRGWDGSIVGLLQFPDVLRWLDGNAAWTDEMGEAVTYQQGDVLQAIQDFRLAAKNAGNLQSNQYQKVVYAPDQDIQIEPAQPETVYVPSYDPALAVQPQPAPAPGINPWIVFGGGAVVGALGAWALYSIFDNDHDHHHREIRGYRDYQYYGRGRRGGGWVDWRPRPRPYRSRPQGWDRPRRLEHAARPDRPTRKAALRPPTHAPQPQNRQQPERERQAQRQQDRQQRQVQQQQARQQRAQQQREQRQQKQAQRRAPRQAQQDQQRQRQERQRQQQAQPGERQQQRRAQQQAARAGQQRQRQAQQQGQRQKGAEQQKQAKKGKGKKKAQKRGQQVQ